jgi:hypothetical protein
MCRLRYRTELLGFAAIGKGDLTNGAACHTDVPSGKQVTAVRIPLRKGYGENRAAHALAIRRSERPRVASRGHELEIRAT